MDINESRYRWGIYDFALLSILIYLFLTFVYPEKLLYYGLLLLPHLIIAIMVKTKSRLVYMLGTGFSIIAILIGLLKGLYPIALMEWGSFFRLGYSLRFSELMDFLFFVNYVGILYFSIKGLKIKQNLE